MPPRFMTIEAFAAYVNISKSTVQRLMAEGLPCVRVTPRNPRILVSEAIAWFSAREVVTVVDSVLH